ncbi:MAG: hypothetical protein MSH24_01805 [Lachnospiraceae bacterium]|nr:hypothetical protein [Lachnospiraceae bacterium]
MADCFYKTFSIYLTELFLLSYLFTVPVLLCALSVHILMEVYKVKE